MILETERLLLRRFTMPDYVALDNLLGCNVVMASSMSGSLNGDQIKVWLETQIEVYKSNEGVDVLAVVEKRSAELIGYCGLFHFADIDGVPEIEIGYRLVQAVWGNGYATEAACAIRDYAFSQLKLPRLVALIEPTNTRSIRVAEKIGMNYEKDVMLEGYDYPDYLYSMGN